MSQDILQIISIFAEVTCLIPQLSVFQLSWFFSVADKLHRCPHIYSSKAVMYIVNTWKVMVKPETSLLINFFHYVIMAIPVIWWTEHFPPISEGVLKIYPQGIMRCFSAIVSQNHKGILHPAKSCFTEWTSFLVHNDHFLPKTLEVKSAL